MQCFAYSLISLVSYLSNKPVADKKIMSLFNTDKDCQNNILKY